MKKYKFSDIEYVRIKVGSTKWRADHPELGSIGWGETKKECAEDARFNLEHYNSPKYEERLERKKDKELMERCYNCWKEVDFVLKRMRNNDNEDDFNILEKLLYEYKVGGKSLYKQIEERYLLSVFKDYARKRFWEEHKEKKEKLFHKWLDNSNKQKKISEEIWYSYDQSAINRLHKAFKVHYEEMESAYKEIREEGLLDEFEMWLENK